MKKLALLSLILVQVLFSEILHAAPKVEVSTNMGNFIIELDDVKAPKSTANFLNYVDTGFYYGTTFHRVIRGVLIQGGGYTSDLALKPTGAPIVSEAQNGLKNQTYSVAFARLANPDSATSQFFVNTRDNDRLNYPNVGGNGYTVFGQVIAGMDVIDLINGTPTYSAVSSNGANLLDVPLSPVIINSIKRTNNSDVKNLSITSSNTQTSSSKDMVQYAKQKCFDLGFKDKTEAFGKCVLRLSK